MKENQGVQAATLEQALITRLQILPIPIRIRRYEREGGFWYQWSAMVAGTGDCGTFADALMEALTYAQRYSVPEQYPIKQLLGSVGRAGQRDILSLQAALRRLHLHHRRVKATEAMYLLVGGQAGREWLSGEQALDLVLRQRLSGSVFADWECYIECGPGPDAEGIYVFVGKHAYRAFDLEQETIPTASSSLAYCIRQLWLLAKRDFAPDAAEIAARHGPTIEMLARKDNVAQSALVALMADCLEIYADNPRRDG